jgi:hypothetical protein
MTLGFWNRFSIRKMELDISLPDPDNTQNVYRYYLDEISLLEMRKIISDFERSQWLDRDMLSRNGDYARIRGKEIESIMIRG